MTVSLGSMLQDLAPGTDYHPPASWLQGRTAYGGLSAALALHVARQTADTLPPLKAAQVAFIGPLTAPARFEPALLRQGKSTTQIGVDARVEGQMVLRAGFVFGHARPSQIVHRHSRCPNVGLPDDYASMPPDAAAPGHFRHFDVRFAGGSHPVSGSPTPELTAWVRLKEAADVHPEIRMLALADCLPPAAMACFNIPAPVSSMNWTVDFPHPAQPAEWFLLRSRSVSAADGYSFQWMEVWDEQRRLVLLGTQTVAVFV